MNAVILIAGIAGIGFAGWALYAVVSSARRRRAWGEIAIAVGVAAAAVVLLITFGDVLVR